MKADIVARWERAAQRARDEQVRVMHIHNGYYATSSSGGLGGYALRNDGDGWSCECPSNSQFGMPCKHLWALTEVLDLDLWRDIHIEITDNFEAA